MEDKLAALMPWLIGIPLLSGIARAGGRITAVLAGLGLFGLAWLMLKYGPAAQ